MAGNVGPREGLGGPVPSWVAHSLTSMVQGACMMWEGLGGACTRDGSTQSYLYRSGCLYDVGKFEPLWIAVTYMA